MGQQLCLMTGRFTGSCERDLIDVHINTGPMIFGKDALTDFTSLIRNTFSEEDNNLPKLLVRALTN